MTRKSPNPVDLHIANQLRKRREYLQLSQTIVAGALGVSYQQIQKYEKGVDRISASRLYEVSQILKVSILYFFPSDCGHFGKNADLKP